MNEHAEKTTIPCPSVLNLSTWHDGEKDPAITDHLESCQKCRRITEDYARIDAAIQAAMPRHREELAEKILARCRRSQPARLILFHLARAAAILMIVLGLVGMFLQRYQSETAPQIAAPAAISERISIADLDNWQGNYLVLIKVGDQLRPLHGPRLAEPRPRQFRPQVRDQLVGIEDARRQTLPATAILPRTVQHVWVVDNLEESQRKLLELLPEGTRCAISGNTEEETLMFTLWLEEEQAQTLVDRMAGELDWALVSSDLPQPGQGNRMIWRGGEIQYTCSLIAR